MTGIYSEIMQELAEGGRNFVDGLLDAFGRTKSTQVALRERILSAMGSVADPRFGSAFADSLSQAEAIAVRQAAARGIASLKDPQLADALAAATSDSDAGVRKTAVLRYARLDADHWMTAGLGETVNVLVSGRTIFTPIKLDKGVNAAVFAGPKDLLVSGYLWEENRKQMAYKPFVIVQREGRGNVIAFTADPNFRAFMDGLNVLFLNAVFRGPAHARASGGRESEIVE